MIRNSFSKRIKGFVLLLFFAGIWEMISRSGWVAPHYLPPASKVSQSLLELTKSWELVNHALVTLKRVALGFICGTTVGYLLGFICGYVHRVYNVLEMTVECLRPMPSIALIPIGILFLGIGDSLSVAISAWACSWPVFVNTMDAVRSTDQVLLNTARTFGYNRWGSIRKVIAFASLPIVFTGLRVGLGITIAVVIITEMIVTGNGLGFFIFSSSISYRVPEMYAGIVAIGLFGYGLNRFFRLIEGRVLKWQRGFSAIGA